MNYEKLKDKIKKLENGMYAVDMSFFYPDNCSDMSVAEVSLDVLKQLLANKRADHNVLRKEKRHASYIHLGDEEYAGTIGIFTDSPEAEADSNIFLQALRNRCGDVIYRRGVLLYLYHYTEKDIAEMEHVSQAAVHQSIVRFRKMFMEMHK